MGREKFAHSFAKYRLEQNNLKIYHGSKRILEPVNSNFRLNENRWDYGDFITEITKGVSLMPELTSKSRIIKRYEEFIHRTGIMISSRKPTMLRFSGQKVEYYLTMPSTFKRDVGDIPRGHYVEVDLQNHKAKLLGPNSNGLWFTYKKTPPAGLGYYGRTGLFNEPEPSYENLLESMTNFEQEDIQEKIPIKELVVGVCLDTGRLVAIPEENFNPVMFITGKRRQGKSLLMFLLLGLIYHKWKKKCINMNDIAHESESHSLEWRQERFIKWLAQIGLTTRAIPFVYLSPSTNTLKTIPLKDEVGFKITMPFKEWILDYGNILKGNDEWEFQKTAVYFRNLLYDDTGNIRKDGLLKCKTFEEIRNFVIQDVNENAVIWNIKKPEGVISKIINVMKDIYNAQILDISTNHKAKWTVELEDGTKEEYHPWTACLIADLVPSIMTSNLRWHKQFHPHYMKYIMEDIYKMQTENELFLKNKSEVFFFIDELTSIIDSKNATVMNDTFEMVVRESGPNRIGVVFSTQFIDKVPELPKSQANYIFSFKQNERGAEQLIKDFDALKEVKSDLKRLDTFQCIGFPSGSPFYLYDEEGRMEEIRDEPVRMMIFPSLSAHKPPKEIKEDKQK